MGGFGCLGGFRSLWIAYVAAALCLGVIGLIAWVWLMFGLLWLLRWLFCVSLVRCWCVCAGLGIVAFCGGLGLGCLLLFVAVG